ncbi:MAG: hypothetical protein ACRDRZ_11230 [Pseudonocardiaceae bacterium]
MKYQDAASFRQALERRLKEHASGDGTRIPASGLPYSAGLLEIGANGGDEQFKVG